jgi:cytochrome c oxidase subunit II
MVLFGVIAVAILIPVALLIPWFPTKASVQAGRIHTLYYVLLIATIPIFVLVLTVVVFSVWKFHMRPGEEEKDGPPIHGNTRLEVVWTALPAVLILGLCTYSYTVLRANEASKKGEMTVNVTARQFAFEFGYPEAGGKEALTSVLYLPIDRPVVFKIRSYDVVHSFFVPSFSEKLDAVPGITTTLRVTPDTIGTYPVECTELCGAGHAFMRTSAHVVSATTFAQWLAAQPTTAAPPIGTAPPDVVQSGNSGYGALPGTNAPSAPPPTTTPSTTSPSAASPAAGQALFTSSGCSGCHTLAAAGATGTVGPNLDVRLRTDCATPASKRIRGATLAQCIHTAITNPYAFIPSGYSAGIMPSTFAKTLTPTQIQDLVSFLESAVK